MQISRFLTQILDINARRWRDNSQIRYFFSSHFTPPPPPHSPFCLAFLSLSHPQMCCVIPFHLPQGLYEVVQVPASSLSRHSKLHSKALLTNRCYLCNLILNYLLVIDFVDIDILFEPHIQRNTVVPSLLRCATNSRWP